MTIRKLSFVGILTALPCLLLPPAVRPAGAQTAAEARVAARGRGRQDPGAPQAQPGPAAASAVKTPFLWRIEGPVPRTCTAPFTSPIRR